MGGSRSGLTLVEVTIAVALVAVIAGSAVLVNNSSTDAYRTGQGVADLDRQGRKTLAKISGLVQASSRLNVDPRPEAPFSTPFLDFVRGEGFAGTDVLWSDPERIELQASPSDPGDGLDNDGNGVIDECRIVWIENPGTADERTVVLCQWVREHLEGEQDNTLDDNDNGLTDERGLCFDLSGDRITIRLTLEKPDPRGFLITRSFVRTVSFRNRD